jgi:hypothetical protein
VKTSGEVTGPKQVGESVSATAQPQSDNSNGNPLLTLVFKTAFGSIRSECAAKITKGSAAAPQKKFGCNPHRVGRLRESDVACAQYQGESMAPKWLWVMFFWRYGGVLGIRTDLPDEVKLLEKLVGAKDLNLRPPLVPKIGFMENQHFSLICMD